MFDEGVEYWYRVNDDTQFVTANWIGDLTAALQGFDPPNLGVVQQLIAIRGCTIMHNRAAPRQQQRQQHASRPQQNQATSSSCELQLAANEN